MKMRALMRACILVLLGLGAALLPAFGLAQTDYFAQAPSISSAEGSFVNVTGVNSISSANSSGTQVPNSAFSLQLNTNQFTSKQGGGVCPPGYPDTCLGWVQFRYQQSSSNPGNLGSLSIQYWLPMYGAACPTQTIQGRSWTLMSGAGCFLTTPPVSVPAFTIANLGHVRLYGKTNGGVDTATITINGQPYSTTPFPSPFPNLRAVWNRAEFNIFGLNGVLPLAKINNGASAPIATITVKTRINNGATHAPACVSSATTYEQNGLALGASCCPYSGGEPSIVFVEGNTRAQYTCASLGNDMITATVAPLGGGTISPAPSSAIPVNVPNGTVLTFTVTPNPGYTISSVTGCGGTLKGHTYTTAPATASCAIKAVFGASIASAHAITSVAMHDVML
jgi:hypothetical protein